MRKAKGSVSVAVEVGEIVALIARAERQIGVIAQDHADDEQAVRLQGVLRHLSGARARLEGARPGDNRAAPRIHERAMACLRFDGRGPVEAEIQDLSAGGALIACEEDLENGQRCYLELDGLAAPVAALIRAAGEGQYHLLFEKMDADRTLALTKHLDRFYFRI